MSDFWSSLDQYDGARPAEKATGGDTRRPKAFTLPEEDYEFEIVDAAHKMAGKDDAKKPLLTIGLRVVAPFNSAFQGNVVEIDYWLTDEESVGRAFRDLVTLGMDAQGQFGQALKPFLPQMAGRRFQATRKNNTTNGKTYNNVWINRLVSAGSISQPLPAGAASFGATSDAPF